MNKIYGVAYGHLINKRSKQEANKKYHPNILSATGKIKNAEKEKRSWVLMKIQLIKNSIGRSSISILMKIRSSFRLWNQCMML